MKRPLCFAAVVSACSRTILFSKRKKKDWKENEETEREQGGKRAGRKSSREEGWERRHCYFAGSTYLTRISESGNCPGSCTNGSANLEHFVFNFPNPMPV